MAENLSSINSALSQLFAPDLAKQWNRTAVLLGVLSARGDVGDGKGKNVSFDAEFSGNAASTVAEGSDVATSEYASDVDVPVILPWAHYRTAFQISEVEYNAAMSSGGTPAALQDLFGNRILGGGATLSRKIETDLMSGTGTDANGNPTIVGLFGGALVASGAYAGINTVAFPEWASTILGNGGVTRALTSDLMAQADAQVFLASAEPYDLIMTTANISRKYEGLFTSAAVPMVRMNDNSQGPQYGLGVGLSGQSQPMGLFYKGYPVMRNPVLPTGKLIFANTRHIQVKYLPHIQAQPEGTYTSMIQGVGNNAAGNTQATNIPFRVQMLAKTGTSYKVMMTVSLQACVTRPNSMAIVADVSEV